jgi:hypothetical protein
VAIIKPKFVPLNLGVLNTNMLYACLRLVLGEGEVHFSIPAQKHAYKHHPDSYMTCLPFVPQTVQAPTRVGQGPHHAAEGFELIRRFPKQGLITLVAVTLTPSNEGVYQVKSVYPINDDTLARRVRKKFIVEV